MPELLGGYTWVALLQDGTEIEQLYKEDGQEKERSVEYLRTLSQPVVAINLIPLDRATHAPITILVSEGDDWIKHWQRMISLNTITGETTNMPAVDVFGLRPKGRSRKPTFMKVFADGSILITTDKNKGV